MGRITKIEEKLAAFIEMPFRNRKSLDPVSLEIALKRLIENEKKNILDRVFVPNSFKISMNEKVYRECEPFFDEFKAKFNKSLSIWIKEKDYEVMHEFEFDFQRGQTNKNLFDISVTYRDNHKEGTGYIKTTEENSADINDKVSIVELINNATGDRYQIQSDNILIGRGSACSIKLDDPAVSDNHARITCQYGKVVLEDIGSTNGTRVNNERVKKMVLSDGDRIMIGEMELMFKITQ